MKVTLDLITEETPAISTFYFKPDQTVRFVAGQFIELSVPHDFPDDRGIKRWFTLSSSPTEKLLSITTRFTSDISSTFKDALRGLKPGTQLDMAEPMGDFVLPKSTSRPLIFVAGGIGVTPFHSMLSWLAATGEHRPISMLYGVRVEEDIIFQDTFVRAHQHVTIVASQPSAAWGGERGQLNADIIVDLEKPSADSLIYLSGPEPMIESLASQLNAKGIKKDQIVTDFFPGYEEI